MKVRVDRRENEVDGLVIKGYIMKSEVKSCVLENNPFDFPIHETFILFRNKFLR